MLGTDAGDTCVILVRSLLMEVEVRTSVKILNDSSSVKSTTARRGPGRVKHIQLRMLTVQKLGTTAVSDGGQSFEKRHLDEVDA